MYNTVRFVIALLLFSVVVILRKKISHLKTTVICVMLLVLAINFLPFENLLIRFSTPEAVIEYCYPGQEISQVYKDSHIDFVVFQSDSGKYTFRAVEHDDRGWKIFSPSINVGYTTYTIAFGKDVYFVNRIEAGNRQSEFLYIIPLSVPINSISDSQSNKFSESNIKSSGINNAYYTFTSGSINSNYQITINGVTKDFKEFEKTPITSMIIIQCIVLIMVVLVVMHFKKGKSVKVIKK